MEQRKTEPDVFRLNSEELLVLDSYRETKPEPKPSREEALREILEDVKLSLTYG